MKLIELVIALNKLVADSRNHSLDSRGYLNLVVADRDAVQKQYSDIRFDKVGDDQLEINLRAYTGLFYDKNSFLQQCSLKTFDKDFGIVIYEDSFLHYDAEMKISISNATSGSFNNFAANALYYLKFRDEFETAKIVSYHSSPDREFVLISPEYGKLVLGYPPVVPEFPADALKEKYTFYHEINKALEFEEYFKGHIIKSLKNMDHDQAFPEFLKRLRQIVDDSNKDYEIFVNKFSFEKLKENFRKERDEYFSKVRDIVNQLLAKVISIPISISASALAIYNLKSDPVGVTVVVIAYIIYSLFTAHLFRLIHNDAFELKADLNEEIEIIKKSAKVETKILDAEAAKVFRKIRTLNITLIILQLVLATLSIVVLFVYMQFVPIATGMLLLLLACVFFLQLIFSFAGLNIKHMLAEQ